MDTLQSNEKKLSKISRAVFLFTGSFEFRYDSRWISIPTLSTCALVENEQQVT